MRQQAITWTNDDQGMMRPCVNQGQWKKKNYHLVQKSLNEWADSYFRKENMSTFDWSAQVCCWPWTGPVFCLLIGVSSGCAQPITGQVTSVTWPVIGWAYYELSLAQGKLRLCSANHRSGYFNNLACDWLSIVWAYFEQETENRPCCVLGHIQ